MRPKALKTDPAGVVVIDKPAGPTSFDVVRHIRKAGRYGKVGHTGTLDPMATGVLPVCIGAATKLVPFLQEGPKEYEGRMMLGMTTDTEDITGRVTAKRSLHHLDPEDVVQTISEFVGPVEQTAPDYSAVKIGGRPAYRMARAGERVPPRARSVEVYDFLVMGVDLPFVAFRVRVSKGTYIRTLAADIGKRLGAGACLESLRRLASAPFTIDQAIPLDEAVARAGEGRLEESLFPVEEALSFMPVVNVTAAQVRLVENGQPIPLPQQDDFEPRPGPVRIQANGRGLIAVYEYNHRDPDQPADRLIPVRVLARR